jgi:hypothetical protein
MATKKRRAPTDSSIADGLGRHRPPEPHHSPHGAPTIPGYPPFHENRMHPSEYIQRPPPSLLSFGHLVVAAILGVSVVAVVVACTIIVMSRMPLPSATTSTDRAAGTAREEPSLAGRETAARPSVAAHVSTGSSAPPSDFPPSDLSGSTEVIREPPSNNHVQSPPLSRAHSPRLIGRGRSTPAPTAARALMPSSTEPPPSETEPLRNGTVEVTPTPYGVLFVDGRRHGYTPTTVQLPAGPHRLRVDREGYMSEERTLTVAPDGEVRWSPHLQAE